MRLLQPGYRFTTHERWMLVILLGGAGLIVASVQFPALVRLLPDCPIHRLLGLHCPGCGAGRSAQCIVQLDLWGALRQNPLPLLALPYIIYRLATIVVGAMTGRRLVINWPHRLTRGYQIVFIAVWLLLAVVRTATWLWPDFNPSGWALPGP